MLFVAMLVLVRGLLASSIPHQNDTLIDQFKAHKDSLLEGDTHSTNSTVQKLPEGQLETITLLKDLSQAFTTHLLEYKQDMSQTLRGLTAATQEISKMSQTFTTYLLEYKQEFEALQHKVFTLEANNQDKTDQLLMNLEIIQEKDNTIHIQQQIIHEQDNTIHIQQQTIQINNNTIHNQQQTIQEKDNTIHNQQQTIHKKDNTIHNQQQTIQINNNTINNQQQIIHEKDNTIHIQQQMIQNNNNTIHIQQEILQEKDNTIYNQKQNLQEKDDTIYNQKTNLREKDDTILNQQQILQEKGSTIQVCEAQVTQYTRQILRLDEETNNLERRLQNPSRRVVNDCEDVFREGGRESGVYTIYPNSSPAGVRVYCEVQEGRSWTVFLVRHRQTPQENFTRSWQDYKEGFGDLEGEHWLGNEKLNALTDGEKHYRLRVEATNLQGEQRYGEWQVFKVADEDNRYRLTLQQYNSSSSSLGDDLTYHNGQSFTTVDRDHDTAPFNCAAIRGEGGWWWGGEKGWFCGHAQPTSPLGNTDGDHHVMSWGYFTPGVNRWIGLSALKMALI
ncbi:angiopoietin-1-like isoform X1 [Homarus americanus]|uniref:angiopoietin-1-like isoform X1 n=2 Tax=Homarus americanus TaxID=6706 RepID=UPI001C4696A4|nr:angiopoietin-1-like isoform X1 [Homarus americanus]